MERVGRKLGASGCGDEGRELSQRVALARGDVLSAIRDVHRAEACDRPRAREGLKQAFDKYFDLLWESFIFERQMAHARAEAEARAAEEAHEAEMQQIMQRGLHEKLEDLRDRAHDEAAWKQIEAEYQKTLQAWEAHVQKLFADRLTLIRSEQSGRRDRIESWQADSLSARAEGDALALYLDGLIEQAIASGDPVSISAPSTGGGESSLINTLLAALDRADDRPEQKPKSMPQAEFDAMLDRLFS